MFNFLQDIDAPPPLFAIKIVNKYCGVWGKGGGRQNPTKENGAPPLSVIKIVMYCGVWEEGALRGTKILQKIMAPLLSVIKLVKYCGVMGGGGGGAKILQKIMPAPSLSLR